MKHTLVLMALGLAFFLSTKRNGTRRFGTAKL